MPDPRKTEKDEIELAPDEIDALVYEAGPDADHDRIVFAVERIITARMAPALALADEWQATYDRWKGVSDGPRVGINRVHANRLRQALSIPSAEQNGDDRG